MPPTEPTDTVEKTILIIDDDREIASMLHGVLQNNGYRVFLAPNGAEGQRQLLSRIATRRLGTVADISNAVLFLAGEQAGWITGQTLSVDGGK